MTSSNSKQKILKKDKNKQMIVKFVRNALEISNGKIWRKNFSLVLQNIKSKSEKLRRLGSVI